MCKLCAECKRIHVRNFPTECTLASSGTIHVPQQPIKLTILIPGAFPSSSLLLSSLELSHTKDYEP